MKERTRTEISGLGEISYVQCTSEPGEVAKGVLVYQDGADYEIFKTSVFVHQEDKSGEITVYHIQSRRVFDRYHLEWGLTFDTFIYSDCEIIDPVRIHSTYYYRAKDSDVDWVKRLIKLENMRPPKRYEKRLPYVGDISYESWSSSLVDTSGKLVYDTFLNKIHIDKDNKKEGLVIYHSHRLFPFFTTEITKYTKCKIL